MSNNCKEHSVPCGCKDTGILTPPPCGDGIECPDSNPCSETFDADCIFYTGEPILCGTDEVISANTSLTDVVSNVIEYFCTQNSPAVDIVCGVDIVVVAGASINEALDQIVAYFCGKIFANTNHAVIGTPDPAEPLCTDYAHTITYLDPLGGTIGTTIFNTRTCEPLEVCTLFLNDPEPTDRVVLCRGGVVINASFQSILDQITTYGLFAQTADSVVISDPGNGTLIGPGVGSLILPTTLAIGDSYRAKLAGRIVCSGTQKLTLILQLNGGSILTSLVVDLNAALNGFWNMEIDFTIRSLGPAGQISASGAWTYVPDGINSNVEGVNFSDVANIDTTIVNPIDILASWNLNEAGVNTINSELFTLTKTY